MNFNERVTCINKSSKKGKYILYWMQGAFRIENNHTFEFSKYMASIKNMPFVVLVVIDFDYKGSNARGFKFFIEGVLELFKRFEDLKISCHVKIGKFTEILPSYLKDAEVLVTDKSYLNWLKNLRREIYSNSDVTIYEVDTNLVVPATVASSKCEYGAYTIRPKINKLKYKFLNDFFTIPYKNNFFQSENDLDEFDIQEKLNSLEYVKPLNLKSGESGAKDCLKDFLTEKYHFFSKRRGDPAFDNESNLSIYLHFGFISPVKILTEAAKVDTDPENYNTLFEQLVVRRELAHNFTYYTNNIDELFSFLPDWAKSTLKDHENDKRYYLYSLDELENCKTHDNLWNAAQFELINKGKIHNYMRMYWGKKVIEWSESYESAYKNLIYLNDKYALDGRDPNGYAGIAWCFGMHDRAFKERAIFGKIRYMSENGLIRKFDMNRYLMRVGF